MGGLQSWECLQEESVLTVARVFLWAREHPCAARMAFYRHVPLYSPNSYYGPTPSLSSFRSPHRTQEWSLCRTWSSPFLLRGMHLQIFFTTYPYMTLHREACHVVGQGISTWGSSNKYFIEVQLSIVWSCLNIRIGLALIRFKWVLPLLNNCL
jgi:hypothetical protein